MLLFITDLVNHEADVSDQSPGEYEVPHLNPPKKCIYKIQVLIFIAR